MKPTTDPVYLTHIDPGQNMARFYEMSLQPTLFGEVSVLRHWGRIGTRGQTMMVTYAEAEAAGTALRRLQHQKQRRGYQRAPDADTDAETGTQDKP